MPRWLVVVNRHAGPRPIRPEIVQAALAAASVTSEIHTPASRAETIEILQDAARRGTMHFAVAGGDGTVNLAANALLDLELGDPPTLAVLPVGTGCDLLRTFGIPVDLGEAARHMATDTTYDIDVVSLWGTWGRRHYVNVAQVGVGAAAAATAPRFSRRLGALRYSMAFALRLGAFPRAQVRVTTERRTYETEALAVIMANGQFFAGGWNVAPKATLVDGVVDIQVIDTPKHRAPALVPKLVKGTHLGDRAVRRFSAAEFKIETTPEWPLEADGDHVGNTTVEGRVVAAALRLKI